MRERRVAYQSVNIRSLKWAHRMAKIRKCVFSGAAHGLNQLAARASPASAMSGEAANKRRRRLNKYQRANRYGEAGVAVWARGMKRMLAQRQANRRADVTCGDFVLGKPLNSISAHRRREPAPWRRLRAVGGNARIVAVESGGAKAAGEQSARHSFFRAREAGRRQAK